MALQTITDPPPCFTLLSKQSRWYTSFGCSRCGKDCKAWLSSLSTIHLRSSIDAQGTILIDDCDRNQWLRNSCSTINKYWPCVSHIELILLKKESQCDLNSAVTFSAIAFFRDITFSTETSLSDSFFFPPQLVFSDVFLSIRDRLTRHYMQRVLIHCTYLPLFFDV